MAEFSASDAAFTGFRIVAQRPWTVGVWAVLQFAFTLGIDVFVALSAGDKFVQLTRMSLSPPTQDPSAVLSLFGQVAPTYLVVLVASLVLNAIVYAAMNRAVMRPAESRFGYLRLASDELRQLALFAILFGLLFAGYIASFLVGLVLMVVIALVSGGDAGVALGISLALLLPLMFCAFIYAAVRLSLASPLTFDTRKIDPRIAWRLTRGRFWLLFGTYFIAFALSVVVAVLAFAIAAAAVAVVGGMPALGGAVQSDYSSVAAVLTPTRLTFLAVTALGQALIWPVTMAPPAAIYRLLGPSAVSRAFD